MLNLQAKGNRTCSGSCSRNGSRPPKDRALRAASPLAKIAFISDAKTNPSEVLREIERLDPEPVPSGNQQPRGPGHRGGNANSPLRCSKQRSPNSWYEMNDDFRVAGCPEAIAFRLERGPDALELVNFAGGNERQIAVFALKGLSAPTRSMTERRVCASVTRVEFIAEHTATIRSAMLEHLKNALNSVRFNIVPYGTKNPAH